MTGGIEAAGDIASGALLGRAVEPGAGEQTGASVHGVCLNCGTALVGEFCYACGQSGHVHRTLASIGHDLLHGVFHFEGKVWRTLPMLVAHPGRLTRRYIDGERARFVSPLALFLFFVFLMFATIHLFAGDGSEQTAGVDKVVVMPGEVAPQLAARQARLVQVENDIANAKARGLDKAKLKDERETLKDDIKGLQKTQDMMTGVGRSAVDPHTGWPALDHGIKKANANPALALYKLQTSAYKYSWLLIPISVPFVALLFLWRRQFKMYDHAIFVTYSLAFMMLLVTIFSLLLGIGAPGWMPGFLIAFAPPVHLFAQLRGTYNLNWYSALWRTFALMIFGSITLTLFVMLLLGLGLMG